MPWVFIGSAFLFITFLVLTFINCHVFGSISWTTMASLVGFSLSCPQLSVCVNFEVKVSSIAYCVLKIYSMNALLYVSCNSLTIVRLWRIFVFLIHKWRLFTVTIHFNVVVIIPSVSAHGYAVCVSLLFFVGTWILLLILYLWVKGYVLFLHFVELSLLMIYIIMKYRLWSSVFFFSRLRLIMFFQNRQWTTLFSSSVIYVKEWVFLRFICSFISVLFSVVVWSNGLFLCYVLYSFLLLSGTEQKWCLLPWLLRLCYASLL